MTDWMLPFAQTIDSAEKHVSQRLGPETEVHRTRRERAADRSTSPTVPTSQERTA